MTSGIIIIIEHAGTDIDPVSCGQLLKHGGAGGGVDNDGRDERGQHANIGRVMCKEGGSGIV